MNQPLPGTQPAPARQASAREFLAVLFRRKWIILGLFLVTTATVVTVAIMTPTYFVSSGRILVKRGERQTILRPERQIFSEREEELDSEMQIMKSAPVLVRARELLAEEEKKSGRSLALDPASLDVEVMGKSSVIAVGYTSIDPMVAQVACRVVMDAYMEYRRTKIGTEQPRKFFDGEIAGIEKQIRARMEERRRYSEESGVAAPLQQTNSWVMQSSMLEQRRSEMLADLAAAQTDEQAMVQLQADPNIDLPTLDGSMRYTNESALITLKTRIVEQQARIAFLSETLRDDTPELAGARQTLETLQGLLRKEVDQRVRLAGSRVQQMQAKVRALDQEIATIQRQLVSAPEGLKKMEEIDADLAALRFRLKELTESRDQAMITANTSSDVNVVMLAPAGVATPKNQLDLVRLMLAPAFSLLVGLAVAFFVDGLDLTVRTANQAEEYLDLPVLASLSERRRRG